MHLFTKLHKNDLYSVTVSTSSFEGETSFRRGESVDPGSRIG